MSLNTDVFDEVAYTFDGTLEGLLSAIFAAYEHHEDPSDITPENLVQLRLSQRISFIETDQEHADRVYRGICKTCGVSAFHAIRKASLSSEPDAAGIAYRFVRYALSCSNGKSALSNITHPAVEPLFKITRAVDNECEKMRQFIRFEHLRDETSDFWFARCNPRDSVVPLIMGHFIERFNAQPFIIYDENHRIAGVYDGQNPFFVRSDDDVTGDPVLPPRAQEEAFTQAAWKNFYRAVSIDARYNPELRQHFMPQRLWKNITEMQEDIGKVLSVDRCHKT